MKTPQELPTLVLLIATYSAFAALSFLADTLPLAVIIVGLGFVIALHSSLQHEVLHGHPFRNQQLSDATVFPALGLFVPYLRFKDTHLAHHFDPNLTDPYDDPESNFLDAKTWKNMPRVLRSLARFNNTLLGRMAIGPAIGLARFYAADAQVAVNGNARIARSYLWHFVGMSLPLIWVLTMTALPLWAYICAAYLAMSLLKIRTYLEHQAHERAAARSVIIEDRGVLALLFLNNNYHAVHHAHPQVVWHRLPQLFEERRDAFLKRNEGYSYRSYAQVLGQFVFKAKDPVVHPIWNDANRTRPKAPRP